MSQLPARVAVTPCSPACAGSCCTVTRPRRVRVAEWWSRTGLPRGVRHRIRSGWRVCVTRWAVLTGLRPLTRVGEAVKIGDTVVYLTAPLLFGLGVYVEATEHGLMVVEFADGTREVFRPEELDTPDRAHLTAA